MLVDEADSILIDEARTPLIISALPGEDEEIASRGVSLGGRGRAASSSRTSTTSTTTRTRRSS